MGIALVAGSLVLLTILWDAFETILMPRTPMRRLRLARVYYRITWRGWVTGGRLLRSAASRERYLAIYGPLSIIGLLMVWTVGLITAFALMRWSLDQIPFVDAMYRSATTLFTLGSGEGLPHDTFERTAIVAEAGAGIALITMVFAYLPVIYQSFARREVRLTRLDAWAGSPPAAAEVLQHIATAGDPLALGEFLNDWESWCAEVLESHISYPSLAYFRSQHQHQSWISALTAILDVSALIKVGLDGQPRWRAHLTFAVARHAAVDLAQVFGVTPIAGVDRLPADELAALRRDLVLAGLKPNDEPNADAELARLRSSYEPYVAALSKRFLMPLPPWRHAAGVRFNWQTNPRGDGGPHL